MTLRWLMAGSFLFAALPALAQDAPNDVDAVPTKGLDKKGQEIAPVEGTIPADLERFLRLLEARNRPAAEGETIMIGGSEEEANCFN